MLHHNHHHRLALVFVLSTVLHVCIYCQSHAGVPSLTHLFPVGGSVGQTITVNAIGNAEPWPPRCWISGDGVSFSPQEKKGEWKVKIAPDAAPGPRLLRFYNEDGASAPRYFIVSQTPDCLETEPNDRIDTTDNPIKLPCLVHGRMERSQDVDTFKVHLKKDETLIARMDAYILGSTTDPLIRILDENNRVLDWNHDNYYLDPRVTFQAPTTGYYWVQVMGFPYPATSSERLGNGTGYIYRLLLTNQAYIRSRNLPGNAPSQSLQINGWNLNNNRPVGSVLPTMELISTLQQQLITASGVSNETEPNNTAEEATYIDPHGSGNLQHSGDEDWFSFKADKDQWYRFELQSGRLGSPCDLTLALYDLDEKQLKSDDDSATMNDPRIDWQAPSSNRYFLKISSLTHDGGKDHAYRLICEKKTPMCELSIPNSEFTLKPGESTEIKVSINRSFDHDAELLIQASPLPPGISCSPVYADKGKKDVKLVLHATSSTKPFQGEWNIKGFEVNQLNQKFQAGKITVTTTVNNGVPNGYMDQVYRKIDDLWLTVLPQPEAEPKQEE